MRRQLAIFVVVAAVTAHSGNLPASEALDQHRKEAVRNVQVGPRPYYLVGKMEEGPLKTALQQCSAKPLVKTDFSIGHRGAALQFPEHTKESYEAGARMGAGILECDVTFTKDAELVCRHAQCDLHTTTNILETDLADKCRVHFTPAVFDASGNRITPATASCCTTHLTLAEFKTLKGKMDASNPNATTVEEFLGGTPPFRTDLYATGGTLLTHKESIALFDSLDTKFTPELKGVDRRVDGVPIVENDGFGQSGLNQKSYASKMIQDYIDAGIDPRDVFPQSFNLNDVVQWVKEFPEYGKQAVFLDDFPSSAPNFSTPPTLGELQALKNMGVNILAPAMPHLVTTNAANEVVPSTYAQRAKQAGLELISWTTERSGRIVEDVLNVPSNQFYYQTTIPALTNDGDILRNIHVLAQDVGIIGLFSDWPGTVTYYANCMNLK
jgi:glycerophosphoryl diester phosphodiesterase